MSEQLRLNRALPEAGRGWPSPLSSYRKWGAAPNTAPQREALSGVGSWAAQNEKGKYSQAGVGAASSLQDVLGISLGW